MSLKQPSTGKVLTVDLDPLGKVELRSPCLYQDNIVKTQGFGTEIRVKNKESRTDVCIGIREFQHVCPSVYMSVSRKSSVIMGYYQTWNTG